MGRNSCWPARGRPAGLGSPGKGGACRRGPGPGVGVGRNLPIRAREVHYTHTHITLVGDSLWTFFLIDAPILLITLIMSF
jgi:hypothetical protein